MNITIKELLELKQELKEGVTDNIYDNGLDEFNGDILDSLQNEAYNREVELIDKVANELTQIDSIEGHKISGIKQIWGNCWEHGSSMLPEDEYKHHIRYIDSLIDTLELMKKAK